MSKKQGLIKQKTKITTFFTPKKAEKRKSDVGLDKENRQNDDNIPESPDRPVKNRKIEELENFEPSEKQLEMTKLFPGIRVMHPSWFNALKDVMEKTKFKSLSEFVKQKRAKGTVYPKPMDVFSWTKMPMNKIKVLVLGQDPYHGPNQAHGLSFSVLKPTPPPPSLRNMFKELIQDENIPSFDRKPNHGDLTKWADQGVLMLNAVLTVDQASANSHKGKGWEEITDGAIKAVSKRCTGIVFLLWGGFAQKKTSLIDKNKHLVICGAHPSPLSAHRGFFGSKHFSKANKHLKSIGKSEIEWAALYQDE